MNFNNQQNQILEVVDDQYDIRYETEVLDIFAHLAGQFQYWKDHADRNPLYLKKFLWFCAYIKSTAIAHIQSLPPSAFRVKALSPFVCKNLIADVDSAFGKYAAIQEMPRDIIQEDTMRESNIYSSMPFGVLIIPFNLLTRNVVKVWYNDAMCSMMGYTSQELDVMFEHGLLFFQ